MIKNRKNKILHLIKKPVDGILREFIKKTSIEDTSTTILLGDGVFSDMLDSNEIYMLKGHARERGLKPEFPELDYEEVVKKIFEHEKVYLW